MRPAARPVRYDRSVMVTTTPPVRTAIAGLGRSGWSIHARLLAEQPERFTVVAVQDHLPERRAEAERRFGCRSYADFDALLADDAVELVVIAVPSHLHAPYAVAALQAGRHVVGEKPMATSLAEAERMVAAGEAAARRLSVFQNWRFRPDLQKVLAVIGAGTLGRIVQVRLANHGFGRRWDWQTLRRFGGGSLNNTGPHLIDAALALYGEGEPRVLYVSDRVQTLGDAEDHLKIVLTPDPGDPAAVGSPTVDIEITSTCAYRQPMLHVMGSAGGLTGGNGELRWRFVRPGSRAERRLSTEPTEDRSYNRETVEWVERRWTLDEAKAAGAPEAEGEARYYRELFDAVRAGGPLPVTAEQALRQMRVIEECRRQSALD